VKAAIYSSLLASLVLVGCGDSGDKTAQTTNSPSGGVLTAPADYVGALGNAKLKATKTAETATLDQAIQMFGGEKGRNPKDLNELVTEKYIPRIPDAPYGMKFDYDAAEGKVKVVPQ
jgi:hypothetical protein